MRITKPETSREKGGKHRNIEGNKMQEKETEGQRDAREAVAVNILFTIPFYFLSPPFSCLKVKFSQPETCHLSAPFMCGTDDKETRNYGGLKYCGVGKRGGEEP